MGLVLLIIIAIISIVLFSLPTFLNLILSWFICKQVKKYFSINNQIALIAIFIFISTVLTLNIRLPGIMSDAYYEIFTSERSEINTPIKIPVGTEIALIGETSAISFKESYFQSVEVTSGAGIGSRYRFSKPTIKSDNINTWLQEQGFKVNRESDNNLQYKIHIEVNSDDYHDSVEMTLYDGKKITSTYKKRFRKAFYLERNDSIYSKSLLYLTQSTITNTLIPDMLGVKGVNYKNTVGMKFQQPLSSFLSKAITVEPPDISIKTQELNVISVKPVTFMGHAIENPSSNNIASDEWCDKRILFKPRWINKFTGKPLTYGEEGERQGTWLIINKKDGKNSRIFIATDEVKKYIFTREYLAECTDNTISMLLSFLWVDKSMEEINKLSTKKYSSREKYFANQKLIQKKLNEEGRIFWWLKYTGDGALISSKKFTLPQEAAYYDTGLNIVGKFYKRYNPTKFYKVNPNEYKLELSDLNKGYIVLLSN